MYQLSTRLLWCSAFTGACIFLVGCQYQSNCREIAGYWSNREGQFFRFEPNGKAFWLIKFGSEFDTFPIRYHYDCKQQPAILDLDGFHSGPLKGKTLFGILEWTSDSSFRFEGESGTSSEVRPETFNPEQTQRFYREK
ncbi:MAG: hypothetical protein R2791_09220 [Saprospiraceae bacterium]